MKEYNSMKYTVSALHDILTKLVSKNSDTIAVYNLYQNAHIAFHGTKDHTMYTRMVKMGW